MNAKKAIVPLLVLLALSFAAPSASQSGIIVTGADSILNESSTYSQELVDVTSSAGPRIVFQYSNSNSHVDLEEVPGVLGGLLELVTPRNVVQYANSVYSSRLTELPPMLETLVGRVTSRIIVQYANSTWTSGLGYPVELIDDTTPPQASDPAASIIGSDSVVLTWTTDEFADSAVDYGEQSGHYSWTVADSLYVQQHAITLTLLIPGTVYYYQVRNTDQSGNTYTSSEYLFTLKHCVYLPLIRRDGEHTGGGF
ncbi:MAG: fibronectin type III domain-containing protein [Anaerolineae bacterium]|nr:fibronectin type III domain-containing protein [Anaerolineae bacterium]